MMLNKHDEKDTDDWDQIKGWVGAANKDTKHPIQQEMDRMKMQQPQGMYGGGDPGSVQMISPSQDDLLKAITGGIANSNADGTQQSDIVSKAPMPPMPNPIIPRGTSLNMGPSSPGIPASPIDTDNPGTPDQVYNDKAKGILGGIDPAKISQMLENIRQQSNKGQIGAAFAGLGDAIASVGGQNPGHLKDAESAIQSNREFGLKEPGLLAAAGKEQYGLSKQLQADDPNSPFSKTKQNSSRSFLKSLGFKDEEISLIPATSIDSLQSGALTRDDIRQRIKSDAELKKMGFAIQQQQVNATKENQQSERSQAERKERIEHPIMSRVDDFMGGNKSVPNGQAAPHGQTVKQNGKIYTWNGSFYEEQ